MKTIPQHTLDFIDSWLAMRYKWAEIPGFTVLVAKDGKVLFSKSYGHADLESQESLRNDHIFRVASHSKTFTATAIMQLQEKDSLRIDDYAVKFLPWLKDHTDKRWETVTLRQILSHGAGIIRDGMDSDYWTLRKPFPDTQELRQAILEADLVLEPNTKLKYSNYGYGLLGEVIETVSGQTYSEYVSEYIMNPLGLHSTYPDFDESIRSKLASGYTRQKLDTSRLRFPHASTNALAAATGVCSTAKDLSIFFNAQRIGSGKLLTDESKKEMQKVQWQSTRKDESYGLGIDIEQVGNRKLIGHSGGFPGFVTRSYIDPNDSVCVVVLTNCHDAWPNSIARAIYGLIDEFGDTEPNENILKYEGRFSGLHGATDIIAHAGGLRAISSNSWYPLYQVDKLEVEDDATLKVVEADSFINEGELIKYVFNDDGTIKHIIDSGSLRLPSEDDELIQTWE